MTLQVLPDTRLAVITALAAFLQDLPGTVMVAGALPDDALTQLPFAAVYRVPGPPPAMWARWDTALLNIQVWAATEQASHDTAVTVHAILHTLPGTTTSGVTIREVQDITGPGILPDPGLPDLARHVFTVRVTARRAA